MSEHPLPRLRPYARQGKAYYAELRAILKEIEQSVRADILALHQREGKITVIYVGQLALKYELNCKAMFEALEDWNIIPCGTYDRVTRQHRPSAILRAALDARQGRDAGEG